MQDTTQDRVSLITGAGSGIGAACARRLAAPGNTLVLVGLDEAPLADIARTLRDQGAECWYRALDVSDAAATERLFDAIGTTHGRLDAFVGSAAILGAACFAPAISQTREHFERILAVNLVAGFVYSQKSAVLMRDSGGGAIVNISSVGGSAAQEHAAAYCISKGGLNQMTRSLALEWAQYGIRVNAVAPGAIDTGHSDGGAARLATGASMQFVRRTPLGRPGTPAEIAEVAAFLLSDNASFVTGAVVTADGGFLSY